MDDDDEEMERGWWWWRRERERERVKRVRLKTRRFEATQPMRIMLCYVLFDLLRETETEAVVIWSSWPAPKGLSPRVTC